MNYIEYITGKIYIFAYTKIHKFVDVKEISL